MVKVTLDFTSVDEAIVALGKLVGAAPSGKARGTTPPAAERREGPALVAAPDQAAPTTLRTRKGRSDKGVERGPYKEANAGTGGTPPGTGTVTTQPPAPAPAPQAAAPSTGTSTPAAETVAPSAPVAPSTVAAAPSADAVQAAVEKLFNDKKYGGFDNTLALMSRFGVKRGKDLLENQRAEFIARVDRVLAGEAI